MHEIALLLKSFRGDLDYARALFASFDEFNIGGLHLFVVVPDEDIEAFEAASSSHTSVLGESLFADHLVSEPVAGLKPGYINQEIVKLAFWELGLAHNYFCVDSDAVFIRPFTAEDFLAQDGFPFTVLVQDLELQVEPRYFREHWQSRERALRSIQREIGLNSPVILTCHGHQVFSSMALKSYVSDFLRPRNWDYKNALALAPYEFSWYNFWLQYSNIIPIHAREPYVKVFHNESQHLTHILQGVSTEDLARSYVAVVVNSNFTRDLGPMDIAASKPDALSRYLSYGELGLVIQAKLKDTIQRRFKRR